MCGGTGCLVSLYLTIHFFRCAPYILLISFSLLSDRLYFYFLIQHECSLFDYDVYFPQPIHLETFPDVEEFSQTITVAAGQLIPFDGSSHTRAAFHAATNLFEPRLLDACSHESLVALLDKVHPYMVIKFFMASYYHGSLNLEFYASRSRTKLFSRCLAIPGIVISAFTNVFPMRASS